MYRLCILHEHIYLRMYWKHTKSFEILKNIHMIYTFNAECSFLTITNWLNPEIISATCFTLYKILATIPQLFQVVELAWRSVSVMDCHATARGSIPSGNDVFTKLHVLRKRQ